MGMAMDMGMGRREGTGNEGARPPWNQVDGLSLEKRKDGGYLLSRWTQYHRRGRA